MQASKRERENVPYTKPALSLETQANLLLSRGMIADRDQLIERLGVVSYYRLSGYWYPFLIFHNRERYNYFERDTKFDTIWKIYTFDRQLRVLVMDAIERIEVAVRTKLAYHHSLDYGSFAYIHHPKSVPNLKKTEHPRFICTVVNETVRSKETFVNHFKDKYGADHLVLPIWMSTELMSFGTVLTFLKGVPDNINAEVASMFKVPKKIFNSWFLTLNTVRNICAHHGRLWNREIGIKPFLPRKDAYPDWHIPAAMNPSRMFAILTICRHCLNCVAPQSKWSGRVRALIEKYPEIPLASMGFPTGWETSPYWK